MHSTCTGQRPSFPEMNVKAIRGFPGNFQTSELDFLPRRSFNFNEETSTFLAAYRRIFRKMFKSRNEVTNDVNLGTGIFPKPGKNYFATEQLHLERKACLNLSPDRKILQILPILKFMGSLMTSGRIFYIL